MKPTEEKIRANASDLPIYLFKQGNNCEAYRYFGAVDSIGGKLLVQIDFVKSVCYGKPF